jgi:hypothetical protein
MLFDIPFVADWKQIGDYRQSQTDSSNKHENNKRVDYDYKVGEKILICKNSKSILHKAESIWKKTTIDYNDISNKWNYQDSMRNQGKN